MKQLHFTTALAAMLALGGLAAQADETHITYCQGEAELAWGTNYGRAETYDVAMHLSDDALTGLTVERLRIPFRSTEGVSEASAWLSVELPKVKSGKMQQPDVVQVDFEPVADGWSEVALPQGYTLTAEGVYVGYSFKMALPNDESTQPVVTTAYTSEGAFLVHTTGKYRTAFHDLYPTAGQLAMEVELSGEGIQDRAVSIGYVPELNVMAGLTTSATFEVVNHGAKGATSVDYTVSLAGISESHTAQVQLRPVFGSYGQIDFELPAVSERGAYDYTIRVDKVDGEPNTDAQPSATGRANVYNTLPRHRAVLEEYTGTWCGYCPRGFVGLEEMNRLFPDDFIGISYHNGDPMEFTTQFPSDVAGFPDAWLDRIYQTDAFCGIADYGEFGIDYVWQYRCDEFAPASIDVSMEWTDDDHLKATATTTFPIDYADDVPYQLSFALLHDGMTGTTSSWNQSNYYSGDTGWPASMDLFTQGKSSVAGLTFNDVIVARSGVAGISGSVTAPVEADVPQTYSYTFDTRDVVNTSGQSLIQDKQQLRVVAMLIDVRDGSIVNANKTRRVADTPTAIDRQRDASIQSQRFYNLQGQPVSRPGRGLYLRQETLANGRVRTVKMIP